MYPLFMPMEAEAQIDCHHPFLNSYNNNGRVRDFEIRANHTPRFSSTISLDSCESTWINTTSIPLCDRCMQKTKELYVKLGLKHMVPLLFLLFYSLIGAGAFYALESDNELRTLKRNGQFIRSVKREVMERIWELKLENLTKRKVLYYADEALDWYDEMISTLEGTDRQWDFWGAIFYCGTVYTTIGYGNIVPRTFTGKLMTLFYAAFGIPLVFFILNDLGDVLGRVIYRGWCKVKKVISESKLGKKMVNGFNTGKKGINELRKKEANEAQLDADELGSLKSADLLANVHDLPMTVALGITLGWMFLCSAIFCAWENWDYFQAFHFFFVSLTTVGLGDTVPVHHHYMIMSFGLILLGMALVSMCIQVAQAKVEHLAGQILEKLMKRYQVEGGIDTVRDEDIIERTLQQTVAPSWIRALLTRRKKEKLMKELKRRTKVRAVGTQTATWGGGRRGSNAELGQHWKRVYERKLSTAHELLKELEQRYNSILKQEKSPIWMKKKNENEIGSPTRNSLFRSPSRRMSSLKQRLSFKNSKMEKSTGSDHGAYVEDEKPQTVGAVKNSAENYLMQLEPQEESVQGSQLTKSTGSQCGHCHNEHRITMVEEREELRDNRSLIRRWIRRSIFRSPKKQSMLEERMSGAKNVDDGRQDCARDLNDGRNNERLHPEVEEKGIQCSLLYSEIPGALEIIPGPSGTNSSEDQGELEKPDGELKSMEVGVQCTDCTKDFLHVPYVLDDCKLLFKEIDKRLTECQSILAGRVESDQQAVEECESIGKSMESCANRS